MITLGAKLSLFNLPEVDNLLSKDELALETIGKAKIKKVWSIYRMMIRINMLKQ